MAFFIASVGAFHQLNTLTMYLYQAYIMNITQTINHTWLKKPTIKLRNIGISFRVNIQAARLSDNDKSLTASR